MLEGRGADLFMVETFFDLEELVDAVEAVRSVSSLPDRRADDLRRGRRDARRSDGGARRRSGWPQLDVAAFGANHGAGLLAALAALEQMRRRRRALAALPNIGLASLAGGRVIYPHATPEYFARVRRARARRWARGSSAAAAARRRPRSPRSAQRSRRSGSRTRALVFAERELAVSLGEERRRRGLARALREGEWVVSIQLDPPLGGSNRGLIEVAQALAATVGRSASSTSTTTRRRARG